MLDLVSPHISSPTPRSRRMLALAAVHLAAVLATACAAAVGAPSWVGLSAGALAVTLGVALLMYRLRLENRTTHMAADTVNVTNLATLVAANVEIRELMETACTTAVEATGAERAVMLRYLPDNGAEVVGASGPAHAYLGASVTLASQNLAATDAGPEMVNPAEIVAKDDARLLGVSPSSAWTVPCAADGDPWGVLVVVDPTASIRDQAGTVVEHIAVLAGLAVSNAASRRALEVRAATDPLTGLSNHPTFRQMLDSECARALRHGRDLALVLIDVDRFGSVNETLGHAGGDRVLVDLADLIRTQARTEDVIARIGGQEFAWLMPDCTSLSAWAAAERLRAAVERGPLGGLTGLTVSAGACDAFQAEGNAARLYELASGARYWAKHNGRNMCVRYSPEVVVDLSDAERAERLERSRALDAVRLLAQAVDARDPNTQRHSERVAAVSAALAECLDWSDDDVNLLHDAAVVHDVGKIGIPDSVLLKPGPLDELERARIETHAALGAQMVSDVLSPVQVAWVRGHHERWDGKGYPDGLSGHGIPAGARLMAVADAFDAMVSDRPYRRGLGVDVAHRIIREGTGEQFCPAAVEAFNTLIERGDIAVIYESPDDSAAQHGVAGEQAD